MPLSTETLMDIYRQMRRIRVFEEKLAELDRGMLGANGIVGAGIPLTVGAALTAQVKRTGRVAVAFFGDGATNQGQFHEALNLAAVWKLPAVFVIENNGYGEATPMEFV